jgi:hypothetical protein
MDRRAFIGRLAGGVLAAPLATRFDAPMEIPTGGGRKQ